jgi:hemerythrin-like domain-containing protein
MRRSEALDGLSLDHHQALFVAQRLRRADAASARDARAAFLDYWLEHGRAHFVAEEEVLLPELEPVGSDERPEVVRTVLEHTAIRRAALRLEADSDPEPGRLHALGTLLHDHVRFEERVLFALLESLLDDDALAALGARLDAH